jgi:hypothetical protein
LAGYFLPRPGSVDGGKVNSQERAEKRFRTASEAAFLARLAEGNVQGGAVPAEPAPGPANPGIGRLRRFAGLQEEDPLEEAPPSFDWKAVKFAGKTAGQGEYPCRPASGRPPVRGIPPLCVPCRRPACAGPPKVPYRCPSPQRGCTDAGSETWRAVR